MEIRFLLLTYWLFLVKHVNAQARPLPVTWAGATYGPDGPWQAVQVTIGTGSGAADVALYPGGSFNSHILITDYCNNTIEGCNAAKGGLYNPSSSPTADYRSIGASSSISSWDSDEPMNLTGLSRLTLDNMKVASVSTAFNIERAIFASVVVTSVGMPNGSQYPVWLGALALGSPNPVQTFLIGNGSNVTGQLLTGNLRNNNEIPSSSFGLHIGSANLKQQGSLLLGGFDQSRVIGPVASYDTVGVGGEPLVNLIDVNIGVQTGGTPFNTTVIPSLYSASGNTSIPTVLNPLVPYMSLPPDMCATIARWLPVTYRPAIGLYTWNTDDYRFKTIVSSPSYLGFTFQTSDNTNLTIKVPFALLNLTLQSPIVATPQQYFPCHPWTSPSGKYHLGRAFMQAAYLSFNWEQNKFFIAQAAGPGSGPSSIQTINPSDTTIRGSAPTGFATSWSSSWTAINPNSTTPAVEVNMGSGSNDGLSLAAKIGIGVGVAGAALILISLLAFWCIRRRRRRQHEPQPLPPPAPAPASAAPAREIYNEKAHQFFGEPPPKSSHPYHGTYGTTYRHELQHPPGELDAPHGLHEAEPNRAIHEAPGTVFIHEMDSTEVSSSASPHSARSGSEALHSPTSSAGRGQREPVSAVSPGARRAQGFGRDGQAVQSIVSPQTPTRGNIFTGKAEESRK